MPFEVAVLENLNLEILGGIVNIVQHDFPFDTRDIGSLLRGFNRTLELAKSDFSSL